MILLVLFFFCFAPHFSWASSEVPSWDMSGTETSIRSSKTVKAFKNREDCNQSPSENSVLLLQKALEEADHNRKEDFICEVNKDIQIENLEIAKDREFMLNYLKKKKKSENLSEADHLLMTEKMMKYRLLRKTASSEYFFSSTRYIPPEEMKKNIAKAAQKYINSYGLPSHCFFVQKKLVKKKKLHSKSCLNEVIRKVQPIPSPLILAQTVMESGWGSSDLAEEQNNILGLQVKFTDPSSMKFYPNCRRAKKDKRRCLLKFDSYRGSIYEYFIRFNGSHHPGYQKYRKKRLNLYNRGNKYNRCKESNILSNSIKFYAENPRYVHEIKSMIGRVCPLLKNCDPPQLHSSLE